MVINNLDLKKEQEAEVKVIINEMRNSMKKNMDMILVLSDGTKVLFVKRDNKLLVQNYDLIDF